MPKRWVWLGAILLAWAGPSAGAGDIKVQGLAPNQCEGKLTITISGRSADDFSPYYDDKATVTLEKSKGPDGLIEAFQTVSYKRELDVVTLEVPARRDSSAALEYRLSIAPPITGAHPILTDPLTIAPGGSSCLPPPKPTVTELSVERIAGDVYSVRFHLKADRRANLQIVVEGGSSATRLYENTLPVEVKDRSVQFTAELTDYPQLKILTPEPESKELYHQEIPTGQPRTLLGVILFYGPYALGAIALAFLLLTTWGTWSKQGELSYQLGELSRQLGDLRHRVDGFAKPAQRQTSPSQLANTNTQTGSAGDSAQPKSAPDQTPDSQPGNASTSTGISDDWKRSIEELQKSLGAQMGALTQQLNDDIGLTEKRFGAVETAIEKSLIALSTWQPEGLQRADDGAKAVEEKLLAAVNEWWKAEWPDRQRLKEMIERVGLQPAFFQLENPNYNLENLAESRYEFRESNRDGGWVLLPIPGTAKDDWAVPVVASLVQGPLMNLVRRMYPTFKDAEEPARFVKVYRACQLRNVGGDKYEIQKTGVLHVRGSGAPNEGSPRDYMVFVPSAATADQLPRVLSQKLGELDATLKQRATQPGAGDAASISDLREMLNVLESDVEDLKKGTRNAAAANAKAYAELRAQLNAPASQVEGLKTAGSAQAPVGAPAPTLPSTAVPALIKELQAKSKEFADRLRKLEATQASPGRAPETAAASSWSQPAPPIPETPTQAQADRPPSEAYAKPADVEPGRPSGPFRGPLDLYPKQQMPPPGDEMPAQPLPRHTPPNRPTPVWGIRETAETPVRAEPPRQMPPDWWSTLVTRLDPVKDPAVKPEDYQRRIRDLLARTSRELDVACPGSRTKLVAITSQRETLRLTEAQDRPDGFTDGAGAKFEGMEVFQLFVCVEPPSPGQEAWILLPTGGLNFDSPLQVLAALVADPGNGRVNITALDRPAKLRPQGGGLYKVEEKMRVSRTEFQEPHPA